MLSSQLQSSFSASRVWTILSCQIRMVIIPSWTASSRITLKIGCHSQGNPGFPRGPPGVTPGGISRGSTGSTHKSTPGHPRAPQDAPPQGGPEVTKDALGYPRDIPGVPPRVLQLVPPGVPREVPSGAPQELHPGTPGVPPRVPQVVSHRDSGGYFPGSLGRTPQGSPGGTPQVSCLNVFSWDLC